MRPWCPPSVSLPVLLRLPCSVLQTTPSLRRQVHKRDKYVKKLEDDLSTRSLRMDSQQLVLPQHQERDFAGGVGGGGDGDGGGGGGVGTGADVYFPGGGTVNRGRRRRQAGEGASEGRRSEGCA